MNKESFYTFFKGVPKAELNLHLEAVISRGTVRRFYMRRHQELSEAQADKEIEAKLFSYYDMEGFLESYVAIQDLYESPADFDYVFDDLRDYMVRNGIVYAEVTVSPSAFVKKGFSFAEMTDVFRTNIHRLEEEAGVKVRMLVDVSRTNGAEAAERNLALVLENRMPEIIGIGLGGSEVKGPAKLFGDVFAKARQNGLRTVAQAGEDVGPESVWDTLNVLHAARIGNGITAAQDEKLLDELASRKIPLEICLGSNAFTKKYLKDMSAHPVRSYLKKGIPVTLNSANPMFFGTELLNEYWTAYHDIGFSFGQLKKIVRNSFSASFLEEKEKSRYLEELDAAWGSRFSLKNLLKVSRAAIYIAVPSALIFLLATLAISRYVAGFTKKLVADEMREQTTVCVEKLEKTLTGPMKMTEAMAWVFKDGFYRSDEATNDVFVNMSLAYPAYSGFYGCRTDNTIFKGPNVSIPDGYVPTSRGWYSGAVAARGAMCYSDVYVDAFTGELVVTFSQAVYRDGTIDGVISFDYPLNDLSKIVQNLKSGGDDQSFILSADGYFFMHERFTPDDSILDVDGGAYRAIGERLLSAGDGFVEGSLGGRKYIFKVTAIPMTGWLYVLGRPEREVNAYAVSAARILAAAFLLLFVVITAITAFIMQRTRTKEQDLGKNILSEVQYLAVSAKENAATSQEQSAAVKEIVATMEDNTSLSENISRKIKDVSSVAEKTRGDVADGVELLAANVRQLHEIEDANTHTINGIKNLGAKIDNIWDIVTLINSVADQAKIIAFNAELEASAAGEAGKNFHIVATEIRRLANGIIDGTKEIKERITEIQDSSDSLILASEGGTEKINEGVAGAQVLSARFASIKNASEITADSAGDITTIIQQQTAASEQILVTLRQIAAGVESFTTATEQISGAAESFKTIAGNLSH